MKEAFDRIAALLLMMALAVLFALIGVVMTAALLIIGIEGLVRPEPSQKRFRSVMKAFSDLASDFR